MFVFARPQPFLKVVPALHADSAQTAQFVFNVANPGNDTLTFDMSSVNMPRQSKSFPITVTNSAGDGEICEVALTYNLSLMTTGNLPLTFTLTKLGETEDQNENAIMDQTGDGSFMSNTYTLPASVAQTDNFILTVAWAEGEGTNALKYSTEVDYINITVESRQID